MFCPYTELCKINPARVWEWMSEILLHSAFLGWPAEHFAGDPRNLAGILLPNSVNVEFIFCRVSSVTVIFVH